MSSDRDGDELAAIRIPEEFFYFLHRPFHVHQEIVGPSGAYSPLNVLTTSDTSI